MKNYIGLVMLMIFLCSVGQSVSAQQRAKLQGQVIYQEQVNHPMLRQAQKGADKSQHRTMHPNRGSETVKVLYFNATESMYQNHESEQGRKKGEQMSEEGRGNMDSKNMEQHKAKMEERRQVMMQEKEERRMQERAQSREAMHKGRPGPHRPEGQHEKVYQNWESRTKILVTQLGRETYLVNQRANKIKWRVTEETKDVGGYKCVKATSESADGYVTAWFAEAIELPTGPAEYGGLPGLILEVNVNEGQRILKARLVDMKAAPEVLFDLPKGQQVKEEEFEVIKQKFRPKHTPRGAQERNSAPNAVKIKQH